MLGKIVDCQAARTGAIMTEAEGRAAVLQDVIAILNPPKRSKTAGVEDDSGHLRAQKKTSPEKLFHGEISASGNRYFTADETLFLFESFCKHHAFDPHKKDDIDAVTLMVREGGINVNGVLWPSELREIIRKNLVQNILAATFLDRHLNAASGPILNYVHNDRSSSTKVRYLRFKIYSG